MRRVEHLIKQIRRHTENETIGQNDGISDMEFVQALNDAQESMVAVIHTTNNRILTKEQSINAQAGVEEYDLPFDIYTNSHIVDFSWSRTGNFRDLLPLERVGFKERFIERGDPSRYILRGKKVLVNKIPNDNVQIGLMNYNPRLPKLDIRRGQVSAVTLDNGNNTITSLTLDTGFTPLIEDAYFDEEDFLTVVDRIGAIKMKSVAYSAVDTGTGVVTVEGDFVFEEGETIAVGDYVCLGPYSTTVSELPDICEKYLILFGDKRILFRDCSDQTVEQDAEVKEAGGEIAESLAQVTNDVDYIPFINSEDY